jgi:hypothetical protein
MIAANLFVQIEQTSWRDSQSCTSTIQFLPTKVSALYKFALIIASCYIMLQKACNPCNHCVTVLRYNIWRHLVIPCKKTFSEQGVQGSSPLSSTRKGLETSKFQGPFVRFCIFIIQQLCCSAVCGCIHQMVC